MSDLPKSLKPLGSNFSIRRSANELQQDFEICDDINLVVISALKALVKCELEAKADEGNALAV